MQQITQECHSVIIENAKDKIMTFWILTGKKTQFWNCHTLYKRRSHLLKPFSYLVSWFVTRGWFLKCQMPSGVQNNFWFSQNEWTGHGGSKQYCLLTLRTVQFHEELQVLYSSTWTIKTNCSIPVLEQQLRHSLTVKPGTFWALLYAYLQDKLMDTICNDVFYFRCQAGKDVETTFMQ